MRRPSLTQTQARQLAGVLKSRRLARHYSLRDLAARADVNKGSIETLEKATNLAPQPETLRRIATALGLPMTDLMVVADWLPSGELPTLQPYLRAKYGLNASDAAAVDAYLSTLQQRHRTADGNAPPQPHDPDDSD